MGPAQDISSKEEGIALAREVHAKGSAYKLLEQLMIKTKDLPKFSEISYA